MKRLSLNAVKLEGSKLTVQEKKMIKGGEGGSCPSKRYATCDNPSWSWCLDWGSIPYECNDGLIDN